MNAAAVEASAGVDVVPTESISVTGKAPATFICARAANVAASKNKAKQSKAKQKQKQTQTEKQKQKQKLSKC